MMRSISSPAEAILHELGISKPNEIDIEAIAYIMGLEVDYRPLDGCEARITALGDRGIVSVSSGQPRTRQRFSIAHELGHWHFHKGEVTWCTKSDIGVYNPQKREIERIADYFAASLLMPGAMVAEHIGRQQLLSWKLVEQMRGAFQVSLVAMAIRLIELDLFPAILVCHTDDGRFWFNASARVPRQWSVRKDPGAESQTLDLIYKGHVGIGKAFRVPARCWFSNAGAYRYEVLEEGVRTRYNEVFTLLNITDRQMLQET